MAFLADDVPTARAKAKTFAPDVTMLDTGVPGVDLYFCTMGGVPVEFHGRLSPGSEFRTE